MQEVETITYSYDNSYHTSTGTTPYEAYMIDTQNTNVLERSERKRALEGRVNLLDKGNCQHNKEEITSYSK